jgi:broad specificity phosphatase PhoE
MQNTFQNFKDKLPDHKVYLTDNGKEQASDCGLILKNYMDENDLDKESSIIYNSPYLRTRQTRDIINDYLQIKNVIEDYLLIEHQYGLFSDNSIRDNKKNHPEFFEYYDLFYKNEGKFYVKFPMGESPADVALRTRIFLQDMYRECESIDNVFIVSHGTTLKTMIMNIYHYTPEWYANTKHMKNCEARVIDENKNMKILRK